MSGTPHRPAVRVLGEGAGARELALRLGLEVGEGAPALLALTSEGLELRDGEGRGRPVRVELSGLVRPAGRAQPLSRAIGRGKGVRTVVDATAGLLQDAALLCAMGLEVTAVERSAVLHEMQREALARASADAALSGAAARLRLVFSDGAAYLRGLGAGDRPDAVYLDPMHPERTGSALSGLDMRLLRLVVGPDEDQAELLEAARQAAGRRVVVKRPGRAPEAGAALGVRPVATVGGRAVRYEIYAPASR